MRALILVAGILVGGSGSCDAAEIAFPLTSDLVRLLSHALRWQYHWQVEAREQSTFRAAISQKPLSSRSLLIRLGASHQIWSFIPSAGVLIVMVYDRLESRWKLLSVADGEAYRGRTADVVGRYMREQLPGNCDASLALSIAPAEPNRPAAEQHNTNNTIPGSRPCPPTLPTIVQVIDTEILIDPWPGPLQPDLKCQDEVAAITRRWITQFEASSRGRMTLPACSLIDPRVFVLLEPESGEPGLFTVYRDMNSDLTPGKVIERPGAVSEIKKRIESTVPTRRLYP